MVKHLTILLLGIVLGALLHRQFVQWRSTEAAPALGCPIACGDPACDDPACDDIARRPAAPTSRDTASSPPLAIEQPDRQALDPVAVRVDVPADMRLLIPVQGKSPADLTDTFTDSRSEGRSHEAIDIMAPAGTPVLAASDGHVQKLFASEQGGLTMYQFEPTGRYAYYYAHLQRYADGLAENQPVRKGQVIGYVGSTGNASPTAPHLHFAIFLLGPERQWWKGTAINPYPFFTQN